VDGGHQPHAIGLLVQADAEKGVPNTKPGNKPGNMLEIRKRDLFKINDLQASFDGLLPPKVHINQ
jgi:hypothetical protein